MSESSTFQSITWEISPERMEAFLAEVKSRLNKTSVKTGVRLIIVALVFAGLAYFAVSQEEDIGLSEYVGYFVNVLIYFSLPLFLIVVLGQLREYWKHKSASNVTFDAKSLSIGRSTVRIKSYWKWLKGLEIDETANGDILVVSSKHWLSRGQLSLMHVPIPEGKRAEAEELVRYYGQFVE